MAPLKPEPHNGVLPVPGGRPKKLDDFGDAFLREIGSAIAAQS